MTLAPNHPRFVFFALPHERVRLDAYFSAGGPSTILENPGSLREHGWNMATGDKVRIIRGEHLEIGYPDWKLIRLHEDGTLTASVAGDFEFLGWARGQHLEFWDKPKLNPLSTVEFAYSFCHLYSQLLEFVRPRPNSIRLGFEIKNAIFGSARLYLTPNALNSGSYEFERIKHFAPEPAGQRFVDVGACALANRPERAAFELLEQLYAWFGAMSESIPYASGDAPNRAVDASLLVAAGK